MHDHPPKDPTRRGFCLCCLAATAGAAGAWLTPREAFAQARAIVLYLKSDAASAPIDVKPLRANISALQGSGGNIAVLTGRDGKVLIDAGIGVSQPRLEAALDGLTGEPIKLLINTHWHFDHVDGNAWLNAKGARIFAHENTRKRLLSTQRVEDWKTDFPAPPSAAVPTEVFADTHELQLNGETLKLAYYGPAHTDCDISVYFANADVLHTGDTFWNNVYPFIDYSTGGSVEGWIRAAERNLELAGEKTIVVPGHGSIGTRADLVSFRDMMVGVSDRVATLKRQGRGMEDVVRARPTAPFDARYGGFIIDPEFFTRLVYAGV